MLIWTRRNHGAPRSARSQQRANATWTRPAPPCNLCENYKQGGLSDRVIPMLTLAAAASLFAFIMQPADAAAETGYAAVWRPVVARNGGSRA